MESFELNKVAGAALSALLVIFGGKTLLDIVYTKHKADKPAFALPAHLSGMRRRTAPSISLK